LQGYATAPAVEDKITIPYVPSHLHHVMFELMKVTYCIAIERYKQKWKRLTFEYATKHAYADML